MNNKRVTRAAVIGLMTIQSLMLVYSARVHSPTWDEVGHLAAGISHWKLGRFELYSVNPPLVRTIAAAPVVLFTQAQIDWDYYRSDPSLRSEVYVGRRMIDLNGEASLHHFFVARLAVLPIALLGGWLCFLWGRDLFGETAGLVALTLWTFSPNVLAYGSVITPDLGSAVALLGCSYVFWRWMKDPGWSWAFMLTVSLALAMLTKSVWLMLPVVFLLVWVGSSLLLKRSSTEEKGSLSLSQRIGMWLGGRPGSQLMQLGIASLGALLLTNGFYGFKGSMVPLGDYEFVSSRLSGLAAAPADPNCVDCETAETTAKGNRFTGTLLGVIPVPIPANYLLGIDVQTRDFERGRYDVNWQSYLSGSWKQGGWWYYYVFGLFWKVPLATWLILGIGSFSALFWRPDRASFVGVVCLWIPALVFFVIVSSSTGLNRYVRYSLPVLPVLFIWASQLGRLSEQLSAVPARKAALATTAVLCVWLAGVTLLNAPHHLSYFNEIAGGPESGHDLLCDSNIDWGQDLIYLEDWLGRNAEARKSLHCAYFGAFNPASVGIDFRLPPPAPDSNDHPLYQRFRIRPGWYVISKNYIAGHSMPVPDRANRIQFQFVGRDAYKYFGELEPVDEIGRSMNVYHIDDDEAMRLNLAMNQVRTNSIDTPTPSTLANRSNLSN